MAVNLHSKYSKQLDDAPKRDSLVMGKLSNQFDFSGVRTVRVKSNVTVPLSNYNRTATGNRYGVPTEVQDIVQELTLSQDKGFALTIDKGNNADADGTKEAGRMLRKQVRERCVPTQDAYALERLARLAGKVVSNGTALTSDTVLTAIDSAEEYFDDHEIPDNDRFIAMTPAIFKLLKAKTIELNNPQLVEKAYGRGVVAEYGSYKIIKVPSARMPAYCDFIAWQKECALNPFKFNDTKMHTDPPGISGNLLEGRQYYDCFVLGEHCNGVYAQILTANGNGTVVANPATVAATGVTSCATSGATIKYTTDGTDPRYSTTARIVATGSAVDTVTAGTVVKAFAYKDSAGVYPSAVITTTLT